MFFVSLRFQILSFNLSTLFFPVLKPGIILIQYFIIHILVRKQMSKFTKHAELSETTAFGVEKLPNTTSVLQGENLNH